MGPYSGCHVSILSPCGRLDVCVSRRGWSGPCIRRCSWRKPQAAHGRRGGPLRSFTTYPSPTWPSTSSVWWRQVFSWRPQGPGAATGWRHLRRRLQRSRSSKRSRVQLQRLPVRTSAVKGGVPRLPKSASGSAASIHLSTRPMPHGGLSWLAGQWQILSASYLSRTSFEPPASFPNLRPKEPQLRNVAARKTLLIKWRKVSVFGCIVSNHAARARSSVGRDHRRT